MSGPLHIARICMRTMGVILLAAVIGIVTNAINPDGIPLNKPPNPPRRPAKSPTPFKEPPPISPKELENETLHIELIRGRDEADPQG